MSDTQQALHAPKYRRRWYQFSLRSLMLLVLVVSIVCSWYAVKLRRERQRIWAMDRLGQLEYGVGWISPPPPDEETREHPYVYVSDVRKGSDSELALLQDIYDLVQIYLDDPEITAAGLQHLEGLTSLQELSLIGNRVSDQRIEQLFAALPQLRMVERCMHVAGQQADIVEKTQCLSSYGMSDCPFEEVILFLEDFHEINITLDEDHQAVGGMKTALSARKSTLPQVLEPVLEPWNLEAVIRPCDMLITSKDKAARMTSHYSYVKWSRVDGKVVCEREFRILLPNSPTP